MMNNPNVDWKHHDNDQKLWQSKRVVNFALSNKDSVNIHRETR